MEAPEGTAALKVPLSVITSASTVGFPLESRIYLAWILVMGETLDPKTLDIILLIIYLFGRYLNIDYLS